MAGQRRGMMLAAPASGCGKTVLTLALLRAFSRKPELSVCGAKAGPDFIDPGFHSVACGRPAFNLDPWAMGKERILDLASAEDADLLIVEAMMGLFDGAADGTGSGADLAALLGLPVVFVVDAAKQSHSIAALVNGFAGFRNNVSIKGVLLNKVGSVRHETMLRAALKPLGIPVVGAIPRHDDLALPERHLGLVQAAETEAIERFLDHSADLVEEYCDMTAISALAGPVNSSAASRAAGKPVLPIGQRIAIARDAAFSFAYPHLLRDWREAGAEIMVFSPLENEAPAGTADAVYLPGGYPELHCGRLASADKFIAGMRLAATSGKVIYGECGGYMVLGKGIVDKDGKRFSMLGLLELVTSFEKRKLHLGYRKIRSLGGRFGISGFSAHEFHYTSALEENGESLFSVKDALGSDLGSTGLRRGQIFGSYMHVIDRVR